jgi:hypothetical protein
MINLELNFLKICEFLSGQEDFKNIKEISDVTSLSFEEIRNVFSNYNKTYCNTVFAGLQDQYLITTFGEDLYTKVKDMRSKFSEIQKLTVPIKPLLINVVYPAYFLHKQIKESIKGWYLNPLHLDINNHLDLKSDVNLFFSLKNKTVENKIDNLENKLKEYGVTCKERNGNNDNFDFYKVGSMPLYEYFSYPKTIDQIELRGVELDDYFYKENQETVTINNDLFRGFKNLELGKTNDVTFEGFKALYSNKKMLWFKDLTLTDMGKDISEPIESNFYVDVCMIVRKTSNNFGLAMFNKLHTYF